jgi:hypothetical protein
MAITLLYGCAQVETTARDIAVARAFFYDALGAGPIEQELAKQIDSIAPGTSYRCDHVGLGNAVFQLNQPDPQMVFNGHPSIHQAYLERVGPSVTNLNFFVDDRAHAKTLLADLGAPVHLEGPSSAAAALADYGPGNTRPGADTRPFLFMGTRNLIGLDLEIMEPNFLRFAEQSVQYPAFVRPRPQAGDGNLLLERLRIVVADLEHTRRNLARIFTPGCRSKPYAYREGKSGRAFRIGLGGIEIEYCQPSASGPLGELLDRYGAGVIAIDFSARDHDAALARASGSAAVGEEPDWLGIGGKPDRYQVASRDPIGFDTVLEPRGTGNFCQGDF